MFRPTWFSKFTEAGFLVSLRPSPSFCSVVHNNSVLPVKLTAKFITLKAGYIEAKLNKTSSELTSIWKIITAAWSKLVTSESKCGHWRHAENVGCRECIFWPSKVKKTGHRGVLIHHWVSCPALLYTWKPASRKCLSIFLSTAAHWVRLNGGVQIYTKEHIFFASAR